MGVIQVVLQHKINIDVGLDFGLEHLKEIVYL